MCGESIGFKKIKAARKPHTCFWCGEQIAVGNSYQRWCWVDSSSFDEIKVHPECHDAWEETARVDGIPYETMAYENKRGTTAWEA